jgi:tetratricopeptide (TPR) repeat protein
MRQLMTAVTAAIAVSAILCGGAAAGPKEDEHTCAKESGDVAIAACTRAIQSGAFTGRNLAILYINRGAEWQNKNENDKELDDLSEAIKHDATIAPIYKNRAYIFRTRGEFDRAIGDYDTAIKLDPMYTAAYTSRGLTYEAKKDVERARADFRKALSIPPKYNDGQWAHDTARQRLAALGG